MEVLKETYEINFFFYSMADLQDRLRANDVRRRRIDDQLYNMRDHARKITNRILGKDEPEKWEAVLGWRLEL